MSTEYAESTREEIFSSLFRIRASFAPSNDITNEKYVAAAQAMIDQMIPESFWLELGAEISPDSARACFFRFSRQVPLLDYRTFSTASGGIIVRMICQSEFSQGAGRYASDIFSRWLVPSKQLDSEGCLSIDFSFDLCPEKRYFFSQEVFRFTHPSDLPSALSNIPHLIEGIRLNILAVYHARNIASMKSITLEQRNRIIQENISSLFLSPAATHERSAYDQIHQFLLKLSEEEKNGLVKKNIANLIRNRPQNFDRDVFYEMTAFSAYFNPHFSALRDPRHISRVIAMHYLFKKSLFVEIQNAPNERHLSFKLLKSQLTGTDPVIGILVGINLLKESERFDKKHLMGAVQICLPQAINVADSFIVDGRDEKIRIFYLEIQKQNRQPFSIQEVRVLQRELPPLLKKQVENVVHPIFMPRNEEEVLRNIVLLSKQIKFLRDLPHLTIHYEKQTDAEISFLIVLVRLLRENDLPFKELLKNTQSNLRIAVDEIRSAGTLKRRYPKEAVIFRAILDKSHFFRKDYSLDLKRARQKVVSELKLLLGEFRDYNGGMIHKQDEALEQLRKLIGEAAADNEILLENFFYSLRPGIMQTVHPPETLKILYDLLLESLKDDLAIKGFSLKVAMNGKYFFTMITAAAPTFKEEVQTAVSKLKIPSYDLTSSFLHVQELATIGFIFRSDEIERRTKLQQTLLEAMLKWKINFSCQIKAQGKTNPIL
ncbi:MAG: hypothetical protein HW387_408 [Parachlamydiales bacterium]|nr:hypothetical protein [Parachlamydiales bacterium]